MDARHRHHLSPALFLKFPPNEQGQVETSHVFNALSRIGQLQQVGAEAMRAVPVSV